MGPSPLNYVVAFIQPFQLAAVVDALRQVRGWPGLSVSEVRGVGCTGAHPPKTGERSEVDPFERKVRVEIFCRGGASLIPLSQLAEVTIGDGPAQISRHRISRRINIEANVRGRDIASFVAEAQAAIDERIELLPGWTLEGGGQFENLEAACARLSVLVPLALLLIFVLLYSIFNSVRLAALICLNVPLATAGGLVALTLRGYPFSIPAGVGFIALFGVAVLNGVVLVSCVVQKRQ